MAGPGRDTKFDDERAKSILSDLAEGLTRACVAGRNGITDRTLRSWVAKGDKGDPLFRSFASAVKKAERDAEAKNIKLIQAAGVGGQVVERRTITRTKRDGTTEVEVIEKFSVGQWTALAWWGERKFPEAWGKDTELLREIIAEYKRRKADG